MAWVYATPKYEKAGQVFLAISPFFVMLFISAVKMAIQLTAHPKTRLGCYRSRQRYGDYIK